jgi:hypothetical protein
LDPLGDAFLRIGWTCYFLDSDVDDDQIRVEVIVRWRIDLD